jgi:ABC-type uncharacterized transport system permease subunit
LLGDTEWTPLFAEKHFGIWPLVAGTFLTSAIAMAVALPLGLMAAIYLSEFAPARLRRWLKPALESLAGIPTIVYGYFALVFVTPTMQTVIPGLSGFNSLRARIVLGVMLIPIGEAVLGRIRQYAADSPFVLASVVVGNVQYPAAVSDAVSLKLAATQELQRKDTEIEIERKERTKREVQAQGIANAMQIIRGQLNAMYIQHEAIEAQKQMVNSPNHTVVYIPVGPMGVPLTGAMDPVRPNAMTIKK